MCILGRLSDSSIIHHPIFLRCTSPQIIIHSIILYTPKSPRMRATALLITAASILALTPSTWAANYSPCVETCLTSHPILSSCDGDEEGQALADCICGSFIGGNQDPLIKCIKECPTADQWEYSSNLPDECRGKLFPGVKVSSTTATSVQGALASSGTTSPSRTSSSTTVTTNGAVVNTPTQIALMGAVLAGLFV